MAKARTNEEITRELRQRQKEIRRDTIDKSLEQGIREFYLKKYNKVLGEFECYFEFGGATFVVKEEEKAKNLISMFSPSEYIKHVSFNNKHYCVIFPNAMREFVKTFGFDVSPWVPGFIIGKTHGANNKISRDLRLCQNALQRPYEDMIKYIEDFQLGQDLDETIRATQLGKKEMSSDTLKLAMNSKFSGPLISVHTLLLAAHECLFDATRTVNNELITVVKSLTPAELHFSQKEIDEGKTTVKGAIDPLKGWFSYPQAYAVTARFCEKEPNPGRIINTILSKAQRNTLIEEFTYIRECDYKLNLFMKERLRERISDAASAPDGSLLPGTLTLLSDDRREDIATLFRNCVMREDELRESRSLLEEGKLSSRLVLYTVFGNQTLSLEEQLKLVGGLLQQGEIPLFITEKVKKHLISTVSTADGKIRKEAFILLANYKQALATLLSDGVPSLSYHDWIKVAVDSPNLLPELMKLGLDEAKSLEVQHKFPVWTALFTKTAAEWNHENVEDMLKVVLQREGMDEERFEKLYALTDMWKNHSQKNNELFQALERKNISGINGADSILAMMESMLRTALKQEAEIYPDLHALLRKMEKNTEVLDREQRLQYEQKLEQGQIAIRKGGVTQIHSNIAKIAPQAFQKALGTLKKGGELLRGDGLQAAIIAYNGAIRTGKVVGPKALEVATMAYNAAIQTGNLVVKTAEVIAPPTLEGAIMAYNTAVKVGNAVTDVVPHVAPHIVAAATMAYTTAQAAAPHLLNGATIAYRGGKWVAEMTAEGVKWGWKQLGGSPEKAPAEELTLSISDFEELCSSLVIQRGEGSASIQEEAGEQQWVLSLPEDSSFLENSGLFLESSGSEWEEVLLSPQEVRQNEGFVGRLERQRQNNQNVPDSPIL